MNKRMEEVLQSNPGGYVWIVTIGELGQGGSVYGVFRKLENAERYVAENHAEFVRNEEQDSTIMIQYHQGSDWLKITLHKIMQ